MSSSKTEELKTKIQDANASIAKLTLKMKKASDAESKKALKKALRKSKDSLATLRKQKASLEKVKKWKKRIKKNNKNGTYELWITYNSNKKRMQIPVLPEKIEISYPDKNDTVYVYGVGDVTIKKNSGAFVMKWSSFFPKTKCQGSINKPKSPKAYIDFLKAVMEIDNAAKIVFTGGPMRISSLCTIKFDCDEVGGDIGTVNYSITVTEYKKTTVRKLKVKKKKGKKKAMVKKAQKRVSSKLKSDTYVVRSDRESLWDIAVKFYGKGARYTLIYEANKKLIGNNPNKLRTGLILKIPKE